MPKYTIAKLLKAKARIAADIQSLKTTVTNNNSYNTKSLDKVDVVTAFAEVETKTGLLIKIKSAITKANGPVQDVIFRMAETKGQLAWLQTLPTTRGQILNRYGSAGGTPVYDTLEAYITAEQKEALIKKYKEEINSLQDTLDEFNASTKVEVDIDL